jgi:phage terminase large subunit-like protein
MTVQDPIVTPPGIDALDLLWKAEHSAWSTDSGYRRWATSDDLVLFVYTYLAHHLSSTETDGVMSFARHHLQLAAAAEKWPDGQAHRDLMIAPRGAAKSTWAVAAILWSMAHGHRRVWLILGNQADDIGLHMETIRTELRDNQLLLADFPGLRPTRRNNSQLVITRNGCAVAAKGLMAGGSGFKVDNERPSGLWLDDVEEVEGKYSLEEAKRRRGVILHKVLPMNNRAAVIWTGTITMYGSILHDVVRGDLGEEKMPSWVLDGGWIVHYVPALQLDARTGRERSFWPTRYPLAELNKIRHTYDFAMNYQGRPPHPGATANMWRPELIQYLAEPVPLTDRGIWVDVAVSGASARAKHDYMAVVMAGRPVGRKDQCVIEYARQYRMTGGQLLDLLGELCEDHPDIRAVHVEKNQGGELWREVLSPMPTGVTLALESASEPKPVRIRNLLRRYERGAVIHAHRFAELEDGENGLLRYPSVEHDDLIDAVASATADLLEGN